MWVYLNIIGGLLDPCTLIKSVEEVNWGNFLQEVVLDFDETASIRCVISFFNHRLGYLYRTYWGKF